MSPNLYMLQLRARRQVLFFKKKFYLVIVLGGTGLEKALTQAFVFRDGLRPLKKPVQEY